MTIQDKVASFLARRTFDRLTRLSPERLASVSRSRAVSSFRRAAREVPAYGAILRRARVEPGRVRTIESFERLVPICSKEKLFGAHEVVSLCKNGRLWPEATAFTSSGSSGSFSFGVETPRDAARTRVGVDALLDRYFEVSERRTLLVNLIPNVRVPSRHVLAADVGPRIDAALAIVSSLARECEQLILAADPLVLKELIESGLEAGIDWTRRPTHAITGGELLAENLRTYLGTLLGHDGDHPERGQILMSFGVSEIALSLAHETPELRRLRQALHQRPETITKLFPEAPCTPGLLAHFPTLHYLETPVLRGRRRLVVTTLDPERSIPLIRYDTSDFARVLSSRELALLLEDAGLAALMPDSRLPLLAAFGRGQALNVGGAEVFPEQIKESLYADPEIAGAATGQFLVTRAPDADRARVRAQLKRGQSSRPGLSDRLAWWLHHYTHIPCEVTWEPYTAFEPDALVNSPRKVCGF